MGYAKIVRYENMKFLWNSCVGGVDFVLDAGLRLSNRARTAERALQPHNSPLQLGVSGRREFDGILLLDQRPVHIPHRIFFPYPLERNWLLLHVHFYLSAEAAEIPVGS